MKVPGKSLLGPDKYCRVCGRFAPTFSNDQYRPHSKTGKWPIKKSDLCPNSYEIVPQESVPLAFKYGEIDGSGI